MGVLVNSRRAIFSRSFDLENVVRRMQDEIEKSRRREELLQQRVEVLESRQQILYDDKLILETNQAQIISEIQAIKARLDALENPTP